MSDTVAQALLWLVVYGGGIGGIGLVAWLRGRSLDKRRMKVLERALKRLDKR